MNIANGTYGEMAAEAPNYVYQNERYLLTAIKNQLGITEEDMRSQSAVKQKLRDANIDIVLQ